MTISNFAQALATFALNYLLVNIFIIYAPSIQLFNFFPCLFFFCWYLMTASIW